MVNRLKYSNLLNKKDSVYHLKVLGFICEKRAACVLDLQIHKQLII